MTDPTLKVLASAAEKDPSDAATLAALADALGEASGRDRLELLARWLKHEHPCLMGSSASANCALSLTDPSWGTVGTLTPNEARGG